MLLLALGLGGALAAETRLVLEGEVPADGLDHFFLDVEVPQGTVEIEVRHADGSEADILDWGLDDPAGFRGWGGGNAEPAVVGEQAASRSYLAGPLPAGTWRVVVGKAKIRSSPATYAVEVLLRDSPTLAADAEQGPYTPVTLEEGPRWYAGDLHVHSEHSGDARPGLDELADFARGRGLDFVVLSDHNTTSQLAVMSAAQARHPSLLFVPGVEFTTYDGHAGAFGATDWVDHRIGQPGVTIEAAAQAFAEQGAPFILNHPNLELGELCIGCAWDHDLDPALIGGIEVVTGGYEPVGKLFFADNVALWMALEAAGARVAPVGGSDDHQAGQDAGPTASPIGSPTTLLYAESLEVGALQRALQAGQTVVKLQGPDDPMISLWSASGTWGGPDDEALVARVEGDLGGTLRWFVDGEEAGAVEVSEDPFTHRFFVDAPPAGARVRLQLDVDGAPRVLTGTFYLEDAPAADVSAKEGCGGCAQGPAGAFSPALLLALLARRRR
jgi:hypothetical protein